MQHLTQCLGDTYPPQPPPQPQPQEMETKENVIAIKSPETHFNIKILTIFRWED